MRKLTKTTSGYLGALVILLLSLSIFCSHAELVTLDSPDKYTYASTLRGTYIHTPGSVFYIPEFSPLTDAIWFASNAVLLTFIENLDIYLFLIAYARHGASQLTVDEALKNKNRADYAILFYSMVSFFIQARYMITQEDALRVNLEPLSPILKNQFKQADGEFEASRVHTGNKVFDRQVRMTLLKPKKYDYSIPLNPDNPDDESTLRPFSFSSDFQPPLSDSSVVPEVPDVKTLHDTDYGYAKSLLNIAPTPFHYSKQLNPDTPSGKILEAINLMDRSQGDELLLGKNPDGDYFITIYTPATGVYSVMFLEDANILQYKGKHCDPKDSAYAIEPVVFLFSEAGSLLFNQAIKCFYQQDCGNGYIEYDPLSLPETYTNSTMELEFLPAIETMTYYSSSGASYLPEVKQKRGLNTQLLNCWGIKHSADCKSGIFWMNGDNGGLSHIRVVEGKKKVKAFTRELKEKEGKEEYEFEIQKLITSEYPHKYVHPDTVKSLICLYWAIPQANLIKPLLRKAHRKLLSSAARMFIKPPMATTTATVPAMTGLTGLKRDMMNSDGLAPKKSGAQSQFLANLRAQNYYGEMLQNNWIALALDRLRGHAYVENARRHLYGYRIHPGLYTVEPERSRGMLWLAYGLTQMDKPSIRMLLELNELGHFISLTPSVTKALKLALKPGQVVSGRRRRHTQLHGKAYPLWREKLNAAYQEEHQQLPDLRSYRRDDLRNIPEVWKDEEFLNALITVENTLDWQEQAAPAQETSTPVTMPDKSATSGKGAFRRHYRSPAEASTTARKHKPSVSNPAPPSSGSSNQLEIYNREDTRQSIQGRMQRYQWVNKILTYLEDSSWEHASDWQAKGKTVTWEGRQYPLYHKSMGEKMVANEGNMAAVFFIRVNNQALILAAGTHPKATTQTPNIGKKYKILWQRYGFNDKELRVDKTYSLQ